MWLEDVGTMGFIGQVRDLVFVFLSPQESAGGF